MIFLSSEIKDHNDCILEWALAWKLFKLVKKSWKGNWKFSYAHARRHVSGRCAININEGGETSKSTSPKNLVGYHRYHILGCKLNNPNFKIVVLTLSFHKFMETSPIVFTARLSFKALPINHLFYFSRCVHFWRFPAIYGSSWCSYRGLISGNSVQKTNAQFICSKLVRFGLL